MRRGHGAAVEFAVILGRSCCGGFSHSTCWCPRCGGVRRLLAAIKAPESIERVLRAMGQSFEVPELAPARAPPGEESWWGA